MGRPASLRTPSACRPVGGSGPTSGRCSGTTTWPRTPPPVAPWRGATPGSRTRVSDPSDLIEDALGVRPFRLHPLPGGASGGVFRADLPGGEAVVAKVAGVAGLAGLAGVDSGVGTATVSEAGSALGIEGRMLTYLAESTGLPVPEVLHSTDRLLVMEHVENDGSRSDTGEEEAAEMVAALHGNAGPAFGFHWDTVLGGLPQPNPWTPSWVDFFARERLLFMGKACVRAGRMPSETLRRVERLCAGLDRWLEPGPASVAGRESRTALAAGPGAGSAAGSAAGPALVHGDLWGGNVLWRGGRVVAFIDPAIHFADPEVEIAFTTLFGAFGDTFYRRYQEIRPLRPGFLEVRKDLLNLYPLLVHVRLFGGGYLASVERILARFV
ncbi:MAG: fructosamine kinase [Gemmatimonadales bacterium]|nr:MAG: fructosamine kinase [Gemmatimonadales bacterium]